MGASPSTDFVRMLSWRREGLVRITVSKRRTLVEVARKGAVLKTMPEQRVSTLSRLKKRTGFDGDPDDILGMDWLKEWRALNE